MAVSPRSSSFFAQTDQHSPTSLKEESDSPESLSIKPIRRISLCPSDATEQSRIVSTDAPQSERRLSSSVAHLVVHGGYLSGWMRKLSPKYGVGWQKRYFCLLERDKALAYWRTVPEFPDEQPTGSINLVHVHSVDLDGALGIILRTSSRDYHLLCDLPSEKDLWYDRILVFAHSARKTMDRHAPEMAAVKFANWAAQQQVRTPPSRISDALVSFIARHSQLEASTDGMGPTSEQKDLKVRLMAYLGLYDPFEQACQRFPSIYNSLEVPLAYFVPDVAEPDTSNIYTRTLAANLFALHHSREPLDDQDKEDLQFPDSPHLNIEEFQLENSSLGRLPQCSGMKVSRSSSLDSSYADCLKNVRYPQEFFSASPELGRRSTTPYFLSLSRPERSSSIDLGVLHQTKTCLQIAQSSSPLIPNPLGLTEGHHEVKFVLPSDDVAGTRLRPVSPSDLAVPVLCCPDSLVMMDSEIAGLTIRQGLLGLSSDLAIVRQLCDELDGIGRFTEMSCVGDACMHERESLARVLFERSIGTSIHPILECLLGSTRDGSSVDEMMSTCLTSRSGSSRTDLPSGPVASHRSSNQSRRISTVRTSVANMPGPCLAPDLDNILIAHLYVGCGLGRLKGVVCVLISGTAIACGKCFDIRLPNLLRNQIKLPHGFSLNSLHIFPTSVISWPLPPRLTTPAPQTVPEMVLNLENCVRTFGITESEFGFDWSCQEVQTVNRRFSSGSKQRSTTWNFRARTQREANILRQSMIATTFAALPHRKRVTAIRAAHHEVNSQL